ncbi:hypothetical protein Alexa_053 [Acinetobacter phage vB_AbaP_Alexa]|nr:hypothetical protein Alexa_053 [Acinetobacter phage vB_AbaP_Alexa]
MKGYEKLDDVLARAFKQASEGKGKERHANDLPFHEQPMQQVNRMVGVGFSHGQAIKKIVESQNMPPEQAVHELLGAICYIAGGIITLEAANDNADPQPDENQARAHHEAFEQFKHQAETVSQFTWESKNFGMVTVNIVGGLCRVTRCGHYVINSTNLKEVFEHLEG